jgi:hypothetical protein
MPPPRRAFYQQRQSDRSHHAAAGGAHFASPLSTWISDPVMYDDSSASRSGPRRTRLRRDDANEAHRHRRARARRRRHRPIRLNRQQRRYLCLSDPNASVRISAFNWVPPFCPAATARRCCLPIQLPGARATAWLIAALNSVEPYLMQLATIDIFATGEEWARLRRPGVIEMIDKRLSRLSDALGDKAYLDGDRFTAGDLIMTTVTRQSIRDLLTEAVPEYAIVAVSTCERIARNR